MKNTQYKELRIKLGYTQDELATRLGVSRKTINTRESENYLIREEARLAILSLTPKKSK